MGQVARIVVVDDGSGPEFGPLLDDIAALDVDVLRQEDNGGIASALNAGIRHALERGAGQVVTFDQDSVLPEGLIAHLALVDGRARDADVRVGAVVPEFFADVRQAHGDAASGRARARNVIQSGMLVHRSTFTAVGLLREDFFIDLVDTEFELRLRHQGFEVLAAEGTRLLHSLGSRYRRELWGKQVTLPGIPHEVTVSTPFRYYYRTRNRVVVNRLYLRHAPVQIVRDTALDLLHFVNVVLIARPRRAMLSVVVGGLRDGTRDRLGKMPVVLADRASSIRWGAPPVGEGPGR